jgi:hypothetical protein
MLAYLFKQKRNSIPSSEASDRQWTKYNNRASGVTIEMGATWFGNLHPTLLSFLDKLEIFILDNILKAFLFETMSLFLHRN